MFLRTGLNQFRNKAKSFGLRTGTNIRNFYTQSRELAHKAKPHLEKGVSYIEGVNTRLQKGDLLTDPQHRKSLDTWAKNMRRYTDKYNESLSKIDLAYDVLFAPGQQELSKVSFFLK